MIKSLIVALFLSQAPIQDVRVFHERPTNVIDYILADLDKRSAKRVHTIHISGARSFTIDLVREDFTTPKAPVPYWQFWDCPWRQTAQQCVAITSMLQQELRK